jgi:hypothetical protein
LKKGRSVECRPNPNNIFGWVIVGLTFYCNRKARKLPNQKCC